MSQGICYGCRHPDTTPGHCHGTGDLEPTEVPFWPGFTCTCWCRPHEQHDEEREIA